MRKPRRIRLEFCGDSGSGGKPIHFNGNFGNKHQVVSKTLPTAEDHLKPNFLDFVLNQVNQDEIEQAIIAHVKSCINVADGTTIAVDLKAGRGDNGFSATLDIIPTKAVAIQGNIKMSAADAKAVEEAAVTQTRALEAKQADETPLTAKAVDDSAAPKPVTKVGIFNKPAVDTSVVDELINEEPTYSTDDGADDPDEADAYEPPKPASKSIFSRAS